MRNLFKLALLATLFVALTMTPALAKKKAPLDRTVVDGVTLAEVKRGSQLQPYYPATARVSGLHAEVVVSLQVLDTGKVGDVHVLNTSVPDMGFEQAATDAVKRWRFHPALKGGEAIETATVVRLAFSPPTLRAPEGFVFVETSARHYAVKFMDTAVDKTWQEAFNSTADHVDNRTRINAYDMPPCDPSSKARCIYDKSDMIQFNGENPVSVHNVPVTDTRSTPPPPTRRGYGGRR